MRAVDYIKNNIKKEKFLDLLLKHGAKNLRLLGDTYRCTCPIHGGNNDTAFSYNPNNNLWTCFTECGGGDVFTLVAMLNDMDMETQFKEIVSLTAFELGIQIDGMSFENHTEDYLKEVNEWLQYALRRTEIFNQPYDLSKLGTRYRLNSYRGISKEVLEANGVGFLKEMNRYIFPIYNESEEVIGASLRANGNETPKWIHRPKSIKTGQILYNFSNCKGKHSKVYLVEGIIDCLRLIEIGVPNVMCTFGARVTHEQTMILLKNFDEVVLAFDNDEAGQKAINKFIEKSRKIINISVLVIDKKFKDVGEINTNKEFNEYTREVEWWKWLELKEGK